MKELLRTTLRLYQDDPSSEETFRLLRKVHCEQHISYTKAIVAAVNAFYGEHAPDRHEFNADEREQIRMIVREELSAFAVPMNSLMPALGRVNMPEKPTESETKYEADDNDVTMSFDCFGS